MRGRKRWLLLLFLPLAAGIFLLCRKPEIPGGTEAERRAFLERFGWELQEECRRKDLTIPTKFDIVYENYNRIQRDQGFDAIAERIYRFDEVKSVYLMSGAYDLLLLVEAHTLKELAFFVSTKLSTLETVTGTATHFVLKRYKSDGVIFEGSNQDKRLVVTA